MQKPCVIGGVHGEQREFCLEILAGKQFLESILVSQYFSNFKASCYTEVSEYTQRGQDISRMAPQHLHLEAN